MKQTKTEMIGLRVKYNEDLTGTVIDENKDHLLIEFDNGTKYCVLKSCIELHNFFIVNKRLKKSPCVPHNVITASLIIKPLISKYKNNKIMKSIKNFISKTDMTDQRINVIQLGFNKEHKYSIIPGILFYKNGRWMLEMEGRIQYAIQGGMNKLHILFPDTEENRLEMERKLLFV